MRKLFCALLFALISNTAIAKTYIGQLIQNESPNGEIVLQTKTGQYLLDIPAEKFVAVSSLVGKINFVEVHAEPGRNGRIQIDQIPTIISGDKKITGRLIKRANYNGPYPFEIDGLPVKLGRTKTVNGASFDDKSSEYFVDKQVNAVGEMDSYGGFVLQSIMRADVLAADIMPVDDTEQDTEYRKFRDDPTKFINRILRGKGELKSPNWMKGTLFSDSTQPVKTGDAVLIISASGREGDSTGAVNGHFSAGIGYVGADGLVSGEMFNVYVTNEKEIVPGNVNLTDYFGHLVSGQSNYRPTYTMMLYGISPEKILEVKAELDRFHPAFRDTAHPTKITCATNCATTTVQALSDINVFGTQRNGSPKVAANSPDEFIHLSEETSLAKPPSILKMVGYLAKVKRAEFMPGPAFVSILNNLPKLVQNRDLGIKRADFIFGGQTPSARPVGKNPSMGVADELRMQAVVGVELVADKVQKLTGKFSKKKSGSADQCEAMFTGK